MTDVRPASIDVQSVSHDQRRYRGGRNVRRRSPAWKQCQRRDLPRTAGLAYDGDGLRSKGWGFPLTLKGKQGQPLKPKPLNNTRADKLGSGFWKASFVNRRCLIPLNAFAEAEGAKGSKTRTWFSLPDQPVFTAAGIWRDSAEWGRVYSMVMTDACIAVEDIHDRSPVPISPGNRTLRLAGDPEEAKALCAPYRGEMAIDRTQTP
ncbi:SOS response-associated peptidase family protein [Croceicoccus hydrothermalis]|uniref:SOS response-associated peptidase family protein n=1 Tax=Croceicoccus hydrothermalis TaxID=2867964 RepID=UPI0030844D17